MGKKLFCEKHYIDFVFQWEVCGFYMSLQYRFSSLGANIWQPLHEMQMLLAIVFTIHIVIAAWSFTGHLNLSSICYRKPFFYFPTTNGATVVFASLCDALKSRIPNVGHMT